MSDRACWHDDTVNGVCVWCRAEVGTAPTDEQVRIVGGLIAAEVDRLRVRLGVVS